MAFSPTCQGLHISDPLIRWRQAQNVDGNTITLDTLFGLKAGYWLHQEARTQDPKLDGVGLNKRGWSWASLDMDKPTSYPYEDENPSQPCIPRTLEEILETLFVAFRCRMYSFC